MGRQEINLFTDQAHENGVRLSQGGRRLIRRLGEIRESRGYKKSQVADAIGINRSGVTRFENQEADPRLETILRYAHAVGASVQFVVEPVEEYEARTATARRQFRAMWVGTEQDERNSAVDPDTSWSEPSRLSFA